MPLFRRRKTRRRSPWENKKKYPKHVISRAKDNKWPAEYAIHYDSLHSKHLSVAQARLGSKGTTTVVTSKKKLKELSKRTHAEAHMTALPAFSKMVLLGSAALEYLTRISSKASDYLLTVNQSALKKLVRQAESHKTIELLGEKKIPSSVLSNLSNKELAEGALDRLARFSDIVLRPISELHSNTVNKLSHLKPKAADYLVYMDREDMSNLGRVRPIVLQQLNPADMWHIIQCPIPEDAPRVVIELVRKKLGLPDRKKPAEQVVILRRTEHIGPPEIIPLTEEMRRRRPPIPLTRPKRRAPERAPAKSAFGGDTEVMLFDRGPGGGPVVPEETPKPFPSPFADEGTQVRVSKASAVKIVPPSVFDVGGTKVQAHFVGSVLAEIGERAGKSAAQYLRLKAQRCAEQHYKTTRKRINLRTDRPIKLKAIDVNKGMTTARNVNFKLKLDTAGKTPKLTIKKGFIQDVVGFELFEQNPKGSVFISDPIGSAFIAPMEGVRTIEPLHGFFVAVKPPKGKMKVLFCNLV